MRELILVRHAESEYNARITQNLDSQLTEAGKIQAKAVAKFLAESIPPAKLATFQGKVSPYLRCLQTARQIHRATGIKFMIDPGPREVMIFYESFSMTSHRGRFKEFIWPDVSNWQFPNEDEEGFRGRMREYQSSLGPGNFLIVSHGSPVGTLADYEQGKFDEPFSHKVIKNASVTWLVDGNPIMFNHLAYKPEAQPEPVASRDFPIL